MFIKHHRTKDCLVWLVITWDSQISQISSPGNSSLKNMLILSPRSGISFNCRFVVGLHFLDVISGFWSKFSKNPISLGCLSSDPNFIPQYHRQPTRKTLAREVELPYKYRFYRRLFPLSWSTEARDFATPTFFSKMTKPGSPGGGGVDFEPKIVFWGFGPVKLLCWCSYSVSIIGKIFLEF